MKECLKCKTMLEDDELFCHECGTKQEIGKAETLEEESPTLEEQYCVHCGESIEVGSVYCPYCGKPQEVEVIEAEPQIEESKPKEEPVVEEKHEPEEIAEVKEVPVQEEPEEHPIYIEEEEKSKTWLYVLLAVLIGGAIWYFFLNDSEKTTSEDIDQTTPIEQTNNVPVENEEEGDALTPVTFLEQFYKGNLNDADFIKQNITPEVLRKLRDDYDYECPSNDCLAYWVFMAYPAGTDMKLEEGPIISKTTTEGKYKVDFKYSFNDGSRKQSETRTVYLTVKGVDSDYFISDYEVAGDPSKEAKMEEKMLDDGKYNLTNGYMYLILNKEGSELDGFFYFKRGTYCSPSFKYSCTLGNDNRFNASVYMAGKYQGEINGSLKGNIMNVNVRINDENDGNYELKLRE